MHLVCYGFLKRSPRGKLGSSETKLRKMTWFIVSAVFLGFCYMFSYAAYQAKLISDGYTTPTIYIGFQSLLRMLENLLVTVIIVTTFQSTKETDFRNLYKCRSFKLNAVFCIHCSNKSNQQQKKKKYRTRRRTTTY
eukprot:TRINITY_DN2387_c0_g1_i1.p1 TRINITY_DN2387_c0_g1~~TRINITY_DN2387_c0_g1_i1.p1  ORF type:complete len:136 (+),score=7.09 TRINITY_DN2387_c0_g1_i1:114-521(+)